MKVIADILKAIIIIALAAIVAVSGCLSAVFFLSREEPKDIFLFGYAMATDVDENGKRSVWLLKEAEVDSLQNGDGVVYYDGSFCAANAYVDESGYGTQFFDGDLAVAVDGENLVGEIIAMWQLGE